MTRSCGTKRSVYLQQGARCEIPNLGQSALFQAIIGAQEAQQQRDARRRKALEPNDEHATGDGRRCGGCWRARCRAVKWVGLSTFGPDGKRLGDADATTLERLDERSAAARL